MNYDRLFALFALFILVPMSSLADDLGTPVGKENTQIMESSEASLQMRVDDIQGYREAAIRQYGAQHPYVSVLDLKLSIAEGSLAKLKKRNTEVKQNQAATPTPPVQINAAQNNDIVIQLQQMVLNLTNRLAKLEDEVRELRATVKQLSDAK